MNERNYLVRATALNEQVRAFALNATDVVLEMQRRHDAGPAVTAAMGRAAMGALLMGAASLKEEGQSLSVEIRGDGPVRLVYASADGQGGVRGFPGNAHADHALAASGRADGKLDVRGVVGTRGTLTVTKNLGMRDVYQGKVELVSGEVGEDLAYYLFQSEQIPSALGIGVLGHPEQIVAAAGGYLVQLMPGVPEEEIASIEARIAALPHPTQLIREGVTPEGVLARIFPDGFTETDRYPVRFRCPCTRERFEAGIVSLGAEEVRRIIEEERLPYTEAVCHFCNTAYRFTPDEMNAILQAARPPARSAGERVA